MARLALILPFVSCACAVDLDDPGELGATQAPVRVCAEGPVVEGIDVSKWQTDIDWSSAAADGVEFAFIRVNHGLGDLDEKYDYNWSEARRVGILRGTYQYFLPDEDALDQANLLLERMGPLEDDDLPPVLDVEEAAGISPQEIVDKIHIWMNRVEEALGVVPIIYTAKYFWQDGVGAPADFLAHPLWVANYGVECPLMADPWERWDFWQYTSSGGIAGIPTNVDRNHFNGTRDDLLAFIASTRVVDPPPPDPRPDPGPQQHVGDPDPSPGDPAPVGGCSTGTGGTGPLLAVVLVVLLASAARRRSVG